MNMLETNQLSLSYNGHCVLHDVSLGFPTQNVTAVVGPSGCGKSSFLYCCNRLYESIPAAQMRGSVLFKGGDIHAPGTDLLSLRRQVAMIFQRPNPFPCSIAENIAIPLREHGCRDKSEVQHISEEALKRVALWDEIKDRLRQSATRLSGGQQQRLCLARALALQPQVLLMDEPCSALDPMATERIEALINELRKNYCIIIVTHNLAQARRLADNIAVFWLRDGIGTCIEHGAAQTLFDNPHSAEAQQYFSGLLG